MFRDVMYEIILPVAAFILALVLLYGAFAWVADVTTYTVYECTTSQDVATKAWTTRCEWK